MLVTKNWIEKNYNKFNKLYWDGKLPVIEFKINRSRNTWGFASFRYDFMNDTIIPLAITMSNYYDSPENVKIQTLLHEMIHIADYTFQPEHFIRNGRKVSLQSRSQAEHPDVLLSDIRRKDAPLRSNCPLG